MDFAPKATNIVIVVDQLHPRVCYAMETVLGDFLGLVPRLIVGNDDVAIREAQAAGIPTFSYRRSFVGGMLALPCSGLLYEDIIRQANEEIDWFGAVSAQLRTVDYIAQIFYHLTQYELLRPLKQLELDRHDRYPDGPGGLYVHDLLDRVQETIFPHLVQQPQPRAFDFEITIDVDQPWKYLHKPWMVRWGGMVKALLGSPYMRPAEKRQRWQVLLGKQPDPYEVLDLVKEICPADKTKVFFLVDGDDPNDSRFNLRMPPYQQLVRDWQTAGFEIGIHPSYNTRHNPGMMQAEKALLESVVGEVRISRQHFLRYKTPETFRQLIAMGIERDYTLCRVKHAGSPTGVALPYRWFDLQRNVATSLTLVPAMVMDRRLIHKALSAQKALSNIKKAIAQTRAVGGKFVIILHNETFSDVGEWSGWQNVIRQMLKHLGS